MTEALLTAIRRYTDEHADEEGQARTLIPGLTAIRSTEPGGLIHSINQPLVCLVLQGTKRVAMADRSIDITAGDSMLITADVPTVSQIIRASAEAPYLALVLHLDLGIISELIVQMEAGPDMDAGVVRHGPTDVEVADAAQASHDSKKARPFATGTAGLAHANLAAASATIASGRITLHAEPGGVRLSGEIGGLARNGAHVLQVHERGDCSAIDASSAGPYFDPSGQGLLAGGSERIVANERGVARVDQLVRGAVLGGGAANDIGGRALVVLGSTTGATGARIACGVITIAPPGAP